MTSEEGGVMMHDCPIASESGDPWWLVIGSTFIPCRTVVGNAEWPLSPENDASMSLCQHFGDGQAYGLARWKICGQANEGI